VAPDREDAKMLAAVDDARAAVTCGEGIDMTEESMRPLAGDIKQRGRARFTLAP
jgi:hypothetical protein